MATNLYTEQNSDYLKNNEQWHIEDSPWKADQILQIIQKNNLHPKRIVEIGCGAGEILNQLLEKMPDKTVQFYGYDIAPDVKNFWAEREKPRLEFQHADLLQVDADKFDLLLMIDVFEHVENYMEFIRSASTKATYKIYHIPLDISVISILRNKLLDTRRGVGHLHHYVKETALAILEDCGQQVIDYRYTASAIDLPNATTQTKFLNIFRKLLYPISPDLTVKLFGGYSLIVLTK